MSKALASVVFKVSAVCFGTRANAKSSFFVKTILPRALGAVTLINVLTSHYQCRHKPEQGPLKGGTFSLNFLTTIF